MPINASGILDQSTATSAGILSRAWLKPFVPRRWMRNGHVQTIVGNYLRRTGSMPLVSEEFIVPVEQAHEFRHRDGSRVVVPQTSVLCLCHWQPRDESPDALTVVLVHGLEGSAHSGYILGTTGRLWAQGCNVVRMNMRSCGGSDALAPTIYHSGRSEDVAAVVQWLRSRGCARIAVVGYSMGANLVLKYAGGLSLLPPGERPREVCAAAGISPLMDLSPSSSALHLPGNRLYEARFLRAMKRRLRAKAALYPELYGPLESEKVYTRIQSMRAFDGEIVARYGGFRDAEDYYEQTRSSRFAACFTLPTLLLDAADDPFLRMLPETRAALRANPHVTFVETAHGGHCAFLADPAGRDQGRWAEETLAAWLRAEIETGTATA